jgi:nucleoside-diphosphate-sugar epimerase
VEIALGDLGDPQAVNRAVRGVQTVIHCGAAMKGGWLEHRRATVVGTQNILNACRDHGVRKLVHISSLSVVDWAGARRGDPLNESSPFEPRPEARGAYTRAKLDAERLVSQCCTEHALPAVILRPGQIFGGRIPLLTPAVARKLGKRWLMLGNGKVPLPLVYMDDVVDAIVAALDGDLSHGEVIQIVDGQNPTQNEVLKLVMPSASVIRVPRPIVLCLGKLSEFAFAPLRRPSPFSLYRLRSALARRTFPNQRARELLGWSPRVGIQAGMHRAAPHSDTAAELRQPRPAPPVPTASV